MILVVIFVYSSITGIIAKTENAKTNATISNAAFGPDACSVNAYVRRD